MVKVGGSRSRGRRFEPQHRILGDASYYINMHVHNKNKGSQIGQTQKNIFFKKLKTKK